MTDTPPTDLSAYRKEIDEIDANLVKLLDRRAEISRLVGRHKAGEGRQVFDAGRHRAVIEKAVGRSNGSFPAENLHGVMREILSVSLALQKPLRVAYLGPAATFSHQAALGEFGSAVDFEPYQKIQEIFQAVTNDWVDYGVVPVENSTGGMVHDSLDGFVSYDVRICHEILLPIQHSLLSNVPLDQIKVIYSHPQGFLQCGVWLQEHLPDVERVEATSTVKGVQMAKEDEETGAAIGSSVAAGQYGLRVVAQGIEDNHDNMTRFLIISRFDTPSCGDDKTSIMFSIKDKPGALFQLLKPFADRKINLSKIESRPTKKKAWEYVFFVDIIGHREAENVKAAIEDLEHNCHWLRVLGSYPRHNDSRKNGLSESAIRHLTEEERDGDTVS